MVDYLSVLCKINSKVWVEECLRLQFTTDGIMPSLSCIIQTLLFVTKGPTQTEKWLEVDYSTEVNSPGCAMLITTAW
jgi:hypothetical protein